MEPTLFYWIGGALALLAVVVSFLGLREKDFPSSRGQILGTLTVFLVLVLGATTYGVVNARDEQGHRESEHAEALAQETQVEELEAEQTGGEGPDTAGGAGIEVGMDEYSFDPSEASAAASDTVSARNDGQLPHNLTVLDGNEELGATKDVDPGQSAELRVDFDPGDYEMICTIPGHADLGMQGTFTVE
jgi:plastocyanin